MQQAIRKHIIVSQTLSKLHLGPNHPSKKQIKKIKIKNINSSIYSQVLSLTKIYSSRIVGDSNSICHQLSKTKEQENIY